MKKFYSFLFAAVALVGFTACNSDSTEDQPAPEQVGKMEFTANIGEDTKTKLNGLNVEWCEGDQIGIWDGTKVQVFTATNIEGSSATFAGMANLNQEKYYAIYPYCNCEEEGHTANHHTFNSATKTWEYSYNNDQRATEDSFANTTNVSTAVSEGTHLTFVNQMAVLKFQVPAECKLVEFFGDSAMENLVVKAWGEYDDLMQPETDYYVTIPVGTGSYKMYARIDGCKSGKKDITVEKGKIYDVGTLREKQTTTVYLVPDLWNVANARFAVYFWKGSSSNWVDMSDEDNDGIYTAEISEDAANFIFCRMNGATTENNWDNKWNQTNDMSFSTTYNVCVISDWNNSQYWVRPIYLNPNSNWASANAWFAAVICNSGGDGSEWIKMEKVGDNYRGFIKEDWSNYKNIIFCRMNPAHSALSWGNDYVWNQTADLTIPTDGNNCWTITEGAWSYGGGSWSTNTPAN